MDLKPFAMFVRPTGKGVATRYGQPSVRLGWRRDPDTGVIEYNTTSVHALTHDEVARYGRAYRRQIAEECLEEVDADAYLESLKPPPPVSGEGEGEDGEDGDQGEAPTESGDGDDDEPAKPAKAAKKKTRSRKRTDR